MPTINEIPDRLRIIDQLSLHLNLIGAQVIIKEAGSYQASKIMYMPSATSTIGRTR